MVNSICRKNDVLFRNRSDYSQYDYDCEYCYDAEYDSGCDPDCATYSNSYPCYS